MKKLVCISTILLMGCLATENRRVVTRRSDGVAPATSEVWWRTPYTSADKGTEPWDLFVPKKANDPLEDDLLFFEKNIIRWPAKLRPPYNSEKTKPKPVAESPAQDGVF